MMRILLLLGALWLAALTPARAGEGLSPLADRPAAPEFSLEDMAGKTHQLSDYGGRVVVVNFWATWCPPCRAEMPSMQRAWEQTQAEGIVWLAVDVAEEEEQIFTFTGDAEYRFPILLDREGEVLGQWPVQGLPTTLIVDPQGRIAYRAVGGREWDEARLLAALRALLPTGR